MNSEELVRCLEHLDAAEKLLEAGHDLALLARLSLVIDLLRHRHGLPERPLDLGLLN